ncbi:MAG: cytochrome c family protein [Bacteroidota bacterium]
MTCRVSAILFFTLILAVQLYAQPFGYEGSQVCGTCHKTEKQGLQLKIWQESSHANAYKTLQTPEADKIAMEKYNKKAVDSPECLKCHASGYDVTDKKLIGAKFKIEDGVQCETCHGPGSAYKALKIMKSREESVKNGLVVWKNEDEIKADCVKCHNPESPTYKEFNFEKTWAKIKHPVPKG